jgi:hypothetical protein
MIRVLPGRLLPAAGHHSSFTKSLPGDTPSPFLPPRPVRDPGYVPGVRAEHTKSGHIQNAVREICIRSPVFAHVHSLI